MVYQLEAPFVVGGSRFIRAFGARPSPHEEAVRAALGWYRPAAVGRRWSRSSDVPRGARYQPTTLGTHGREQLSGGRGDGPKCRPAGRRRDRPGSPPLLPSRLGWNVPPRSTSGAGDGAGRRRRAMAATLSTPIVGTHASHRATADPQIRGFAVVGPSRDDDSDKNTGELRGLYVDPAHWGRGLGRLLHDAALKMLAENHIRATLWVLATNAPAIHFYRCRGWRDDRCGRTDLIFYVAVRAHRLAANCRNLSPRTDPGPDRQPRPFEPALLLTVCACSRNQGPRPFSLMVPLTPRLPAHLSNDSAPRWLSSRTTRSNSPAAASRPCALRPDGRLPPLNPGASPRPGRPSATSRSTTACCPAAAAGLRYARHAERSPPRDVARRAHAEVGTACAA